MAVTKYIWVRNNIIKHPAQLLVVFSEKKNSNSQQKRDILKHVHVLLPSSHFPEMDFFASKGFCLKQSKEAYFIPAHYPCTANTIQLNLLLVISHPHTAIISGPHHQTCLSVHDASFLMPDEGRIQYLWVSRLYLRVGKKWLELSCFSQGRFPSMFC